MRFYKSLTLLLLVLHSSLNAQQQDSSWSFHAGILYSKFTGTGTNESTFAGIDARMGYNLHQKFSIGPLIQAVMIDKSKVKPLYLLGGGLFARWATQKFFLDASGSYSSGNQYSIKTELITGRLSTGVLKKLTSQMILTPQIFLQYERVTGKSGNETIRPGILLAVQIRFGVKK